MAVDGTEGYKLKCRFDDKGGGSTTNCGKNNCEFGIYERDLEGGAQKIGPGCSTCGVMAVELSSIFDDSEPRFVATVPEDFRRAAAVEIVRSSNLAIAMTPGTELHPVKIMSWVRPGALGEILKTARDAGVEYDGDDLPEAVLKGRD